MIRNSYVMVLVALCCAACTAVQRAEAATKHYTAFNPGDVWRDADGVHINAHGGGILFKDGIYYWYGENRPAEGFSTQVGVNVYSSTDLYNWKPEGVALQVSEDPESEIVRGCIIERPKVIYNKSTDTYVMWFHLELKDQGYGASKTGLAVADSPTGPFTFLKSFRPNAGQWPMNFEAAWMEEPEGGTPGDWWTEEWYKAVHEGMFVRRDFEKGQMARDMGLFVDDDGKAYHIHSSEENLTLHLSELTDDYLDFTGKYITISPAGHNEAPALFKEGDTYYLVASGCTGWDPNAARSFKSKSIWGPWESLGNPCVGKDADLTFHSQSTYVLPVAGKDNAYIFMADRWNPESLQDSRYVWLPMTVKDGKPEIRYKGKWDLSTFDAM